MLAVAVECYMFASIGWGAFAKYPLFDISMNLIFAFVIFSCRKQRTATIIICVVLGLEILVSYINIIMKTTLNNVFAIKMLTLVGETVEVLTFDMFPWSPIIFYGIVIAILVGSLLFLKRIPVDADAETKLRKHIMNFAVAIGLSISMLLYTVQGMFIKKAYLMGDNYLYNTFSDGQQSLKKFGLFGYYIEDLFRLVEKPKSLLEISRKDVEKYLSTETYNPKDSPIWNIAGGNQNIVIIMAESFEWYAISKEVTPVLYGLANGYNFGANGQRLYDIYDFDNECEDGTLMRKDYLYDENGICIGVNGDLEYNDEYNNTYGLTLLNYYSKAKTDYSEDSMILGSYPFNESYVERAAFSTTGLYDYVDYNATLPNILKDSGYIKDGDTSYYHTFKSKFYGRTTLLPMFGFDNMTFYEDIIATINIEHEDRLSHAMRDSEFMRYYIDEFIHLDNGQAQETPWLSFITTITTHGEYNTYNPRIYKNYAFLDYVDYAGKPNASLKNYADNNSTSKNFWSSLEGTVSTYIASCLDTEYMVARLIDGLIKTNQFNNTMIVFFADHNGYYNQLDLLYKPFYYNDAYTDYNQFRIDYVNGTTDLGEYDLYSSERYSVPAFIYSTSLNEFVCGTTTDTNGNNQKLQFIEKFTCAFDLLPTILTICGINYDPHYYLGYPAMCPMLQKGEWVEQGTKVIISHTGGYFNNLIYSEDGITANYTAEGANMKEFYKDCVEHLEKWYFITAIYENNMFEKIKK